MRYRVAGFAIAAVAMLAGGACASPAAPVGSSPGAVSASHSGDLRTYLLTAPTDATTLAPDVGTEGTVTLEQDAAQSADAKGRADVLREYGFKTEAVADWRTSDGILVDVTLIQLSSPTNAYGYLHLEKSDADNGLRWHVPDMPDAITFTVPAESQPGIDVTLTVGQKGDVVILIYVSQKHPATATLPNSLMASQYSLL